MSFESASDRGIAAVIHKVCGDFRHNEVEPVALELDAGYDAEGLKSVWRKSAELEIPSMLVPEAFGGVEQSVLTAARVLDEISYGCAGVACLFAHHLAACIPLIEAGADQGERLKELAEGKEGEPVLLTLAFPSFLEREDRPHLKKKGDALLLEGQAPLAAGVSLADYILLFLEEEGKEKVTCVAVDTRRPGVSVREPEEMLGLHALPFCDVGFEHYEVGDGDVIGGEGRGAAIMEKTAAAFNGFIAAVAMGAARRAYVQALEYARERFQFGKMIIEHHEMRRFLKNMMVKMRMGTAGYTQALSAEELESPLPGRVCDLAKIFCTDGALEIVIDAIQVQGGYGYMKETGLEKIMRDAKMLQLLGKSNRLMEIELESS